MKKINISKGIETNKTSTSKECMLRHYWFFKDVRFKFELHVWNKCHDVFMAAYELKKHCNIGWIILCWTMKVSYNKFWCKENVYWSDYFIWKNFFWFILIFLEWQFWNTFFEGAILKCTHVLNEFLDGAIILISWVMAAALSLCLVDER